MYAHEAITVRCELGLREYVPRCLSLLRQAFYLAGLCLQVLLYPIHVFMFIGGTTVCGSGETCLGGGILLYGGGLVYVCWLEAHLSSSL